MADIDPAYRAMADRELEGAINGLLAMAAQHDGEDIIEANVELANALIFHLAPSRLAVAAAALALRLHRDGAGRG